jgi:hypothetical protein
VTHLYDPHGKASLLRQLLPDVPGGFRGGREGRLQDLQLLRLYGGPRTASLRTGAAVAAATSGAAIRALVLRLAVPRLGIAVQGTFNRSKPICRITIARALAGPGGLFREERRSRNVCALDPGRKSGYRTPERIPESLRESRFSIPDLSDSPRIKSHGKRGGSVPLNPRLIRTIETSIPHSSILDCRSYGVYRGEVPRRCQGGRLRRKG